jgi:endoplasmic reticulum-Golgi intermediate compartment protein 3
VFLCLDEKEYIKELTTVMSCLSLLMHTIVIVYLVAAESTFNFKVRLSETVHVNATSPAGLELEFDLTMRNVPCSKLNIDANDPNGQPQSLHLDRQHHVWKHKIKVDTLTGQLKYIGDRAKLELGSTLLSEDRLSHQLEGKLNATLKLQDENYCGSCFGAGEEGECCNACDDVKRAYNLKGWVLRDLENVEQCKGELTKVIEKDEGCNIHGKVALSSGGGNLHLAPGRDGHYEGGGTDGQVSLFDLIVQTFQEWNVSHTIHKIRFGAEVPGDNGKNRHPLDGEERIIADTYGMYQYYFQVSDTSWCENVVMEN